MDFLSAGRLAGRTIPKPTPFNQSELIKALGVKIPEAVRAAHDAADGNDGVNWELLHELCPAGMDVGQFIDLLCEPHH